MECLAFDFDLQVKNFPEDSFTMNTDLEHFRGIDEMVQAFIGLLREHHPTHESETEVGRFFHIISSIGYAAVGEYERLRAAARDNAQVMMAWSCRNLLELAIFAKFVIHSESNADEFAEDRLIDGLQIVENVKSLEMLFNPNLAISGFDAGIADFKRMMQNEGITRKKFKRIDDLAKLVDSWEPDDSSNLSGKYEAMNRICSKFVHPTAWALLTADEASAGFPQAQELFYLCGTEYFATVCAVFMPHIRQYGMRHKPKSGQTS